MLPLLLAAVSYQQTGIGDPTFPTLGNVGYRADHYALKINYNPDTHYLRADVTMSAVASNPLSTFTLDFVGFEISSVKLNGQKATFSRKGEKLIVSPSAPIETGAKFTVETAYSGMAEPHQSASLPPGLKAGWLPYEGGAVALCEPELAHSWFPCNDHPRNKATFEVDITSPNGYTNISNGALTPAGKLNGFHTEHFSIDKPVLTCMETAIIGKFDGLSVPSSSPTIVDYLPAGQVAKYQSQLDVIPKYLKFLSERLGPYPFSTYGAVIMPSQAAAASPLIGSAALETTTIPVFGPAVGVIPQVLVHELTHQWMGDCVSVTNWGDDIWWVEGFAQFSEWLYTENERGKNTYDSEVGAMYARFAALPHWLKPGHLTAAQMFDAPSYIGGGLTFYALRRKIGDEAFFKAIRAFIQKHKYGNATTQDLIDAASQASGQDLKPFFDAWLYGDTIPKLP